MRELEDRIARLERRVAELEAGGAARPACEADLEAAIGLQWLNRLGAALVVAGLAFGAALANDRGYLSPPVRNALLAAAGLAVLAAGVRAVRGGDARRGVFGQGVIAVGALALFLVPVTASQIDRVLAPEQAALLAAALAVGCAVASHALAVPVLGSFGLVGGLSVPFIGDGVTASIGGFGLVIALYVEAATRRRALTVVDHAAVTAAAGLLALVAHGATGSAWAPAAVGGALAACAAGLRGRGDASAAGVALTTGAALVGVACALGTDRAMAHPVWVTAALVAYALALVGMGVAWPSRLCRLLGLALLAGAGGKLVIWDLWSVDAALRVGALLVLGSGALAASFLYTRHRA